MLETLLHCCCQFGNVSGSCTPGTTGHLLQLNNRDLTGSFQLSEVEEADDQVT
jgi:hypothetical protein